MGCQPPFSLGGRWLFSSETRFYRVEMYGQRRGNERGCASEQFLKTERAYEGRRTSFSLGFFYSPGTSLIDPLVPRPTIAGK